MSNILIIGGTGTLGKAVLKRLYGKHQITILSREELKQQQLKKDYPNVKFVLGDIRDYESLRPHFYFKEKVYHFAAMKHVDVANENPEECIKINLLGTLNVAKACSEAGVLECYFSSTDKAVLPINTYGMCKGISENYLLDLNEKVGTNFYVFRWGNVLGSRGSVIHAFLETLKKESKVYITHASMTRFWINIEDVVGYLLSNNVCQTEVNIPSMKAASVIRIAKLCAKHLGIKDYAVEITGIRSGEKIHECLYTSHDHCVRSDTAEQYSDDEILEMIRKVEL